MNASPRFAGAAALCAFASVLSAAPAIADDAAAFGGSIAMPSSGSGAASNDLAATTVDPSTGTLSSSYPFRLEAARGSVAVSLSLQYSSAAGVGYAGYGWTVGAEEIHRVHPSGNLGAPTYATPGTDALPWDRFSYGGAFLVPLCIIGGSGGLAGPAAGCPLLEGETLPSQATNGWVYFRREVEGAFDRFFLSPDQRTWIIEQKDGQTLQLGAPLDDPSDSSGIDFDGKQIYEWHIVRRVDALGPANQVIYTWQPLGTRGVGFLTDIYDTPANSNGKPGDAAHRTHLDYESQSVALKSYAPRWHTVPDLRLKTVTVTSAGINSTAREVVRRYHLTYTEGDYTSFGYYSLLSSVQLEGECPTPIAEAVALASPGPTCLTLPATTFGYGDPITPETLTFVGLGPDPKDNPTLIDFNSDGLPDFVTPASSPNAPQNLFLNSANGNLGSIARTDLNVDPSTLNGTNSQNFLSYNEGDRTDGYIPRWANIGNWFGDGAINVLWTNGNTCANFSSGMNGPIGVWAGAVAPCYALDPSNPPGALAGLNTLGDLNADGLIDQIDCASAAGTGSTAPHACVSAFSKRLVDGSIRPYGATTSESGPAANYGNSIPASCFQPGFRSIPGPSGVTA
jgi:hypothetical protein